jgi:hypothetical protein
MPPKYPYRIFPIYYDMNGYIKQMVVKCNTYTDVNTEYMLFMDCDCTFVAPYSPKDWVDPETNRIQWYYIRKEYDDSTRDYWWSWAEAIEKQCGQPMTEYFMHHRFPFLYKTKTLRDADAWFRQYHEKDYNQYCLEGCQTQDLQIWERPVDVFVQKMAKIFEEFEFLCWYAKNYTDDYDFIEGRPRNEFFTLWSWSHGGISEETDIFLRYLVM